jgi:hypothetical protein
MRATRATSASSAVRSMSARSSRCAALPPGAAQASSTRMPSRTSSRRAAAWAPKSCTEHRPEAKPLMRSTGSGLSSSTAVSSSARAPMPAASSWATSNCAGLAPSVGLQAAPVGAQAHRRVAVAGGAGCPASAADGRRAGARSTTPGAASGRLRRPQPAASKFLAAAQEVAQHAIHQRLEAATGDARRGAHGLVNRGVGVLGPRFQAHQGHQQQAAHRGLGQRPFEQATKQEVAAADRRAGWCRRGPWLPRARGRTVRRAPARRRNCAPRSRPRPARRRRAGFPRGGAARASAKDSSASRPGPTRSASLALGLSGSGVPRRKSALARRRPPGFCSSVRRSAPSPQATTIPSPSAASICPGRPAGHGFAAPELDRLAASIAVAPGRD